MFLDSQLVASLAIPNRYELPPLKGGRYAGFADAAGGSGADSFTMAISHLERNGVCVLDLVREVKPPFSLEGVTKEFAETFKGYGIRRMKGDRYAGSWPSEQFAKHGVAYVPSEKTKSEIYKESLPLGACQQSCVLVGNSSNLLETGLKHGIELRKSDSNSARDGSPSAIF